MAAFPEWDEVAKEPLVLPIRGVKYEIPPLGYLDGIRIRSVQEAARKAADRETPAPGDQATTMTDEEFFRAVLGTALDAMREANVPEIAITHAAAVAHTDATLGREQALYVWERGLDPEALAADMAAIRKAMSGTTTPVKKTAARKSSGRKRATRSTTSRSTA